MAENHYGHIGVLMGGCSSEREISLKSGQAVFQALKEQGLEASVIDIHTDDESEILELLKKSSIDVAFIALHGELGEDGIIQSILEWLDIPYTGSGVLASQNAINKVSTQTIFQKHNIPIPRFEVVHENSKTKTNSIIKKVKKFPLVIKPATEGSSIGISIVKDQEELKHALENIHKYGQEVLVEEFIEGRELTVGILDDQPLPLVEIKAPNNFFDFTAKYQKGVTQYIVPAKIPEDITTEVQSLALKAHQALGCSNYSRVDLILEQDKKPYFLEVNTIPGFTETSLLPMAAKEVGLNLSQLCTKLIELAYAKKK